MLIGERTNPSLGLCPGIATGDVLCWKTNILRVETALHSIIRLLHVKVMDLLLVCFRWSGSI